MASGYWQILLKPEDCAKTAFVTKYGLFEHVRMGFGLCNAPSTFSRIMHMVLQDLAYKNVLAYLDDVVVLGDSFDSHLENLKEVLLRFRQNNLKLKPKKCFLFQAEINFLGRRVSENGVSIQENKIKTVLDWPVPTTPEEVASFLGTVNYHREFIKQFAHLSQCLYKLVHAKSNFQWGLPEQAAFEALKGAITSTPVLAFPNNQDPFILDCDASNLAVGAELLQIQEGNEKVIRYSSYILTPAPRKYCTTRKELLALVTFTRHFPHYLLGRSFTVWTDHASVAWLMRFKHIKRQLARWCEELSQYHMVILHWKGQLHTNADGLSRIPGKLKECNCYEAGREVNTLPCGGCAYCACCHSQCSRFEVDVDDVVPMAIRRVTELADPLDMDNLQPELTEFISTPPGELRDQQLKDPDLQPVISWLEDTVPLQAELFRQSPTTKHLWNCKSQLKFCTGVLYYVWEYTGSSKLKFLVPESMKSNVLFWMHDTRTGGHFGRDKTIERLKQSFYWYGMARDAKNYVESCGICRRNKKPSKTPRQELGDYQFSK